MIYRGIGYIIISEYGYIGKGVKSGIFGAVLTKFRVILVKIRCFYVKSDKFCYWQKGLYCWIRATNSYDSIVKSRYQFSLTKVLYQDNDCSWQKYGFEVSNVFDNNDV